MYTSQWNLSLPMKATLFSCWSTECMVPPLTLSAESEEEEENLETKDADLV
jgi:hypothetical protein